MVGDARKPTVPQVLPLVQDFMAGVGHGVGGALHIFIEDGNIETEHVSFCREWALAAKCHCRRIVCVEAVHICDLLLRMSKTQRREIVKRVYETDQQRTARLEAEGDRCRHASKDVECELCGLPYWRHPFTLHRFDDSPFLHRLCNGDIVKL